MRAMTVTGPTRTLPKWNGRAMGRDSLVIGANKLDASQFLAPDAVRVTVGVAGAASGAVAVPVTALSGPLPVGAVLDFGGAKFARLTAPAAAGAVALAVAALPTALVSGDVATFAGTQKRSVLSGTYVGRTIAERNAGTGFGPAAATDDERFLVAFTIADLDVSQDVEFYRHGQEVWENYLPGFASLTTAVQDQLRKDYRCSLGAA